MKAVFVLVVLLLCPTLAAAQNVKNPYRVQFCWDGKDDGGTAVTIAVQVRVTIDTTALALQPLPTSTSTTGCPAGANLYTMTGFTSAKGPHTVIATLVTADGEGLPPSPFAYTVVGRPPSTVTTLQATQ